MLLYGMTDVVVCSNNFRLNVLSEVVENGTRSVVKLQHADRTDGGEFLCTSKNRFGHATRRITLIVRGW